jgi:hypothetical protein
VKLVRGTDEYQKFIDSMFHEFTLCEQAFNEFFLLAGENIHGRNDYQTLEKLYRVYSKFIEHLYEFYVACFKRNRGNTQNIQHDVLDHLLTAEVEKLMRNMCSLIENNKAPSWVNDISYYQETVPPEFGKMFRFVRNNASHVDHRRAGGSERPTLKEFMDKYHKFLFFLYDSSRFLWSGKRESPYEVKHIKEFDLSIGENS